MDCPGAAGMAEGGIMPWRRSDYPADWAAIRVTMLARARGRCEGTPLSPNCEAVAYEDHPQTGSLVILTMAHLCRCNPLCGEPSHLRMLCQRCHNSLDADTRARHASTTRRKQQEAQGQLSFWD
jgi:hypothetical protein